MSYKSRSASRRNGRKMLRKASRKSASRRRKMTPEDILAELIWQVVSRIIMAIILGYWSFSLLMN